MSRARLAAVLGVLLAALFAGVALWAAGQSRVRRLPDRVPPAPSAPRRGPGDAGAGGTAARPDYALLERRLRDFLAERPGVVFGIYVKDLETGAELGINADEPIHAASTRKVPLVLYLNRLVADGKARFSDRVAYHAQSDYQGGAGILQYEAREGSTYSLRVLANLAITISDNVATRMLLRHLGRENVRDFMRRLGGRTVEPGGENITTARDMGVYVQAVLDFARENPELGNRLLDDMAHSIYHVGLPGELPPGLAVPHKEGEVAGVADDVGAVFGRRPYILCVLSKNVRDVEAAFGDIARISRLVYDFQESLPTRPR